jgi:hypothetical protein
MTNSCSERALVYALQSIKNKLPDLFYGKLSANMKY